MLCAFFSVSSCVSPPSTSRRGTLYVVYVWCVGTRLVYRLTAVTAAATKVFEKYLNRENIPRTCAQNVHPVGVGTEKDIINRIQRLYSRCTIPKFACPHDTTSTAANNNPRPQQSPQLHHNTIHPHHQKQQHKPQHHKKKKTSTTIRIANKSTTTTTKTTNTPYLRLRPTMAFAQPLMTRVPLLLLLLPPPSPRSRLPGL